MTDPSVAVVILNWNGKDLLSRFLPGVVRSQYSNLQLIVGDNASTDGSVAFIKANYPQIQVLENDHNYGFAEGYNRVLQRVEADYYVLLNSDVEVPENWIEPLPHSQKSNGKKISRCSNMPVLPVVLWISTVFHFAVDACLMKWSPIRASIMTTKRSSGPVVPPFLSKKKYGKKLADSIPTCLRIWKRSTFAGV
jgi:GT2 family glycosyltransferase